MKLSLLPSFKIESCFTTYSLVFFANNQMIASLLAHTFITITLCVHVCCVTHQQNANASTRARRGCAVGRTSTLSSYKSIRNQEAAAAVAACAESAPAPTIEPVACAALTASRPAAPPLQHPPCHSRSREFLRCQMRLLLGSDDVIIFSATEPGNKRQHAYAYRQTRP